VATSSTLADEDDEDHEDEQNVLKKLLLRI
jgi:hypothetical protein